MTEKAAFPLGEDIRWAAGYALTAALGSPFLPRFARLALLQLAGADASSAPGVSFKLLGPPGNLRIGVNCYFNEQVFVESVGPVSIGDSCAFGMQSMIVTSDHSVTDQGWSTTSTGRPVVIGDRVWVGARATILPGAIVEDDVVVAAGAVVVGVCEAGGVYAGVPARRIRTLGLQEDRSTEPRNVE